MKRDLPLTPFGGFTKLTFVTRSLVRGDRIIVIGFNRKERKIIQPHMEQPMENRREESGAGSEPPLDLRFCGW